MKILLITGGGLIVLIGVVLLVGSLLPEKHTASRSARFKQPTERVWETITDVARFTDWRSGLKAAEKERIGGKTRWKESGKYGTMMFEAVESRAPERLVTRIVGDGLPFGGSWTYVITPTDGASEVTITEHGEVYNVFFRFISRFVFGHTATLDQYLKDLARKLGEDQA